MTSYTEEIIECPQCRVKFSHWALRSYNTFGATFWTDGHVGGDMFEDWSPLLICPGCNRFLWRDELTVLYTEDDWRERLGELWVSDPLIPKAGALQESHYLEVLRQSLWRTPEEEAFIRIRVWRYLNKPYRNKPDLPFKVTHQAKANLQRLLELLDKPYPEEAIIKAEILRELGKFKDCLRILDVMVIKPTETTGAVIRRLAEAGERRVAPINPET